MLYSELFVFLMIISTNLIAMDEYTVNKKLDEHGVLDAWANAVKPSLTLQSSSRLAQTCSVYKDIFDPGKITNEKLSCFMQVESNYHRCTHALSRFVQYNNTRMFEKLWEHHHYIRNEYITILASKCNLDVDEKMDIYRKYYNNPEMIEKEIIEQLKQAIIYDYPLRVEVIVRSKKYNIFELFCNKEVELAFKILCENQYDTINFDNLLALLPVEDGEQKNRAVQYIAKYDVLLVLIKLLKKGYLKVNEEYGHRCTLWHYAALRGCRRLTYKLLKKRADIHAVNAWGKQPVDYAFKFEDVHKQIHNKFLYRGHGVLVNLNEYCEQYHLDANKDTIHCYQPYHNWKACNKEELEWLRNSCTYDLEEK